MNWQALRAYPKLKPNKIRELLVGTTLKSNGKLIVEDGWGGEDRYTMALALYAQLPERSREQKVLDLRWLPISRLPIEGFAFLEELYLHENQLSEVPSSISQLKRLRVLSLGRNKIQSLPSSLLTMWIALRRLILGENQIASLPFAEEDMIIEHGSVGLNPIQEPIGSRWMFRKDAKDAVHKIRELIGPQPGCSKYVASIQLERGIALCRELEEPMIYEALFEGYQIKDGVLEHPHRSNPWEKKALHELLGSLSAEVMLPKEFFE